MGSKWTRTRGPQDDHNSSPDDHHGPPEDNDISPEDHKDHDGSPEYHKRTMGATKGPQGSIKVPTEEHDRTTESPEGPPENDQKTMINHKGTRGPPEDHQRTMKGPRWNTTEGSRETNKEPRGPCSRGPREDRHRTTDTRVFQKNTEGAGDREGPSQGHREAPGSNRGSSLQYTPHLLWQKLT